MPELKDNNIVRYNTAQAMEQYYENSQDKQNLKYDSYNDQYPKSSDSAKKVEISNTGE